MNQVFKVVKGKVCSEFAKGAKKGQVSAVVLALMSFANVAQAELAGNSNTTTTGTVTLGADIATNNATNSVVIGNKASTAKDNATVVGANAFNGGANGVVVGRNANSTGNNSIVLGTDASGTGNDVVTLGSKASVTGNGSVAIGYGSVADSNNSVALGRGSTTNGRDNTVSVGYDGNDRAITHVAAGVQANDAVNVSQLNSLGSELGYRVTKLDKDLSGGIASAVAMGMMPTLSEPGRMITGGTGFYNGESAAAIGLTGTLENKKITYKMGATIVSNGDNSFGAGFGYRF